MIGKYDCRWAANHCVATTGALLVYTDNSPVRAKAIQSRRWPLDKPFFFHDILT